MGDANGLRQAYLVWSEQALARWLPREAPHFGQTLTWVHHRFDEGQSIGADVAMGLERSRIRPSPWRVLDLGAGNGGISLGVAQEGRLRVVACDAHLNGEVPELLAATGKSFRYAVARGERLPFDAQTFDAVLLLDVIEHLRDAVVAGREVARVLAPGGIVVVTTPPRARFLFKGDPHLGIWGLALLPAELQRLIAEKMLRRTKAYDVHHLYLRARGIARQFPGLGILRVTGQGRLHRLGLDWDRVVLQKP